MITEKNFKATSEIATKTQFVPLVPDGASMESTQRHSQYLRNLYVFKSTQAVCFGRSCLQLVIMFRLMCGHLISVMFGYFGRFIYRQNIDSNDDDDDDDDDDAMTIGKV